MKKATFVFLILSSCNLLFAQKNKVKNPLSDTAFKYMIIQDITYTIFGESTPVTGIKVDISKPEATFSGVFKSKKKPWILVGFNFKGGVTDKNFSIFKGVNSFNSAYEFKPSIYIIPKWNSAKYKDDQELLLMNAKIQLNDNLIKLQKDTIIIVTLIYNYHLSKFPSLIDHSISLPNSLSESQTQLLVTFIKKFNKIEDDKRLTTNNNLDSIIKFINQADINNGVINSSTLNAEIINTFQKYKKIHINLDREKIKKQITIANDIWTKKNLYWITASPFIRTEKLNLYHNKYDNQDSSYFKQQYPFYYGAGISINMLNSYPDRFAHYWTGSLNFSSSNNITTLSSFNYETRTSFFNYGNSITEKTKSGIAYNSSELRTAFLTQIGAEYYFLPLKSFFPGGYFSSSLNISDLYNLKNVVGRANDNVQISTEAGIIFNISSTEKERNLTSFSMYVRFEDITDSRRTSKQTNKIESNDDYLNRNLSFGLKVGVPINLPQKSK